MSLELWSAIAIIVSLLFLVLLFFLISKRDEAEKSDRALQKIVELLDKVNQLEQDVLQKQIIIQENDAKYNALLHRVKEIEARNQELELYLYRLRQDGLDKNNITPTPRLLLITPDPYTQQKDEIALTKAGINYRRIAGATIDRVEQELRRARQQRRMYEYIMISGHANEAGFVMSDDVIVDSYWMNQNFAGVEILFLNGCKTTQVADDVINVADCVISLLEPIPTRVAQSFAESFWSGIEQDMTPQQAFDDALNIEPSIRPYADIRLANR